MKPNIRRSTEQMTKTILTGSFVINVMIGMLFFISMTTLNHAYIIDRIMINIVILFYLLIVRFLVYRKKIRVGAWMLITLYVAIGVLILHIWGVNTPVGILILGFVIFLANVMLGSKYIISVTTMIIGILILLQYLNIIGISQPDQSLLANESSYGDVAGYSIIFTIFAVIAWLSGTKMETTLKRAVEAESELQKQKDDLEKRVEIQTKRIVDSQQKELKQLYKFAELGQLTTIILHELANYLSVLTLDIDDLKDRHENSIAIEHAKESIFYIDTIIDQVRNQIKDSDDTERFDALVVIKESLEQLGKRLIESNIKLFIEDSSDKKYFIFGDPLRLSQAITILVTNAAQANKTKESEILIGISSLKTSILISVKDFGTGISKDARDNLFEPQKSKKGSGLGIGLYITKQIIDTHFKGKIWLNPATEYTEFSIEIPKSKK